MAKTIKELDTKLNNELAARDVIISDLDTKLNNELAARDVIISKLQQHVTKLECDVETLETARKLDIIYRDIREDLFTRLLDDQNQYSRKTNLIIDGLRFGGKDKDDRIRQIVLKEIAKLKLDIQPHEVDRAHRTGRSFVDKKGVRHDPIIVRFTSWRARNCLYEARFDSSWFIKADVTTRRQNLLQEALSLHENNERYSKFIEYVFVDRNCQLSIKSTDGRFLRFNSLVEFQRIPDFIEDTLPPYDTLEKARTMNFKGIDEEAILVNLSNVNITEWQKEDENNVYIGRDVGDIKGSRFQNPYSLNDFDRSTAVSKYKQYIISDQKLKSEVESLRGKKLGCFCWPEECHGQVLVDILYN